MTARTYGSAAAFKRALDDRLRNDSGNGQLTARARQLLVFDRFLARVADGFEDAATLKGGLVIELRLERARTTKDIDLHMRGSPDKLLERLQRIGRVDLGDFMVFEVGLNDDHPEIRHEGVQYDGVRFRATCMLAGRRYADPFGVDVAFGDPILGEPEVVVAADTLAFAGIAPPTIRIYPVETHLAEKLHAYTLPRKYVNSRVKDLPDLALLGTVGPLDAARLREALEQTFSFRKTHSVPGSVATPPVEWEARYAKIARDDGLVWPTLADVTTAVRTFLDPVLASPQLEATWDPISWRWRPDGSSR